MTRSLLPVLLLLGACSPTAAPDDAGPMDIAPDADPAGSVQDDDDTDADDTDDDTDAADDTAADDTAADTAEETPAEPDGAALYATYCAGCHAADGSGGSGPDITSEATEWDDAALVGIIQGGKDEMPAQDVTDAEAQAIVDWMRASF